MGDEGQDHQKTEGVEKRVRKVQRVVVSYLKSVPLEATENGLTLIGSKSMESDHQIWLQLT